MQGDNGILTEDLVIEDDLQRADLVALAQRGFQDLLDVLFDLDLFGLAALELDFLSGLNPGDSYS